MRCPCNILIAIQAFMDIIVSFGHLVYYRFLYTDTVISYRDCYTYQFVPTSAMNLTTTLMLIVGIDRYICIRYPFRYRRWPKKTYIACLLSACVIYDLIVKIVGYLTLTEDKVICLIADGYVGFGKDFWVVTQVVISVSVLIIYLKIRKQMRNTSPVIKRVRNIAIIYSLYTIVIFYIFGWLTTMVLLGALRVLKTEPNFTTTAELFAGFFANVNMVIPAFVYFKRSITYKNALRRMIYWKGTTTIGPSVSHLAYRSSLV
ncbi:hypothetical protein L596_017132 [Steinernema carpocapsae]|uniref:G-protein coupled receptors family 1 profile domain-containing protein n=1 Tax=Steinernema carpocapsae TaxID=34508 RepID=A0A4U5N0Z4_STECR|nr:hypothetical protein L596_017132 [Steinernema carpocapsae]